MILALLLAAACVDGAVGPAPRLALSDAHIWVFHVGGSYAAHIQIVAIDDAASPQRARAFWPIAARAWDGTATNDFGGYAATPDDSTGLRWTLRGPDGQALRLAYAIAGDTATGTLTLPDGTTDPLVGVRFRPYRNFLAPTLPAAVYGGLPVVMIRLDDIPTTDRDFLTRLEARGLHAEIAVPTQFVGRRDNLSWDDLRRSRAAGMGVVLHSRYHLRTPGTPQHFIAEIVGGFAEMAANGFATHVFVQPGTWLDSLYFDSPAKLETWRGALLRTFSTVSECYAYGYSLPRTATRPLGLGHVTISDGAGPKLIRQFLAMALHPYHATVFLVHTRNLQRPDQLDWFLDSLAVAQARGEVRLVGNSEELFLSH